MTAAIAISRVSVETPDAGSMTAEGEAVGFAVVGAVAVDVCVGVTEGDAGTALDGPTDM